MKTGLLTVLAAGAISGSELRAESVTLRSVSEVRSVNNMPGVSVGDLITVTFTYDSDAEDYLPGLATHGRYQEAATSVSVEIGGVTYGLDPDPAREQRIVVLNDALDANGGLIDAFTHYFDLTDGGGWLWMNLLSKDLDLFADDSLPANPPDLARFDWRRTLVLERWSSGTRNVGDLTARMVADVISLERVDTAAPIVAATVAEDVLWSPNHKFVDVGLDAVADDDVDTDPVIDVLIYSNEPGADDVVLGANGALALRAERDGKGDGRVYLVVVTATDTAGNVGYDCTTVVVPKSQSRKHGEAVLAAAVAAEETCLATGSAPAGWFPLN